jgi:hypothetical protein
MQVSCGIVSSSKGTGMIPVLLLFVGRLGWFDFVLLSQPFFGAFSFLVPHTTPQHNPTTSKKEMFQISNSTSSFAQSRALLVQQLASSIPTLLLIQKIQNAQVP